MGDSSSELLLVAILHYEYTEENGFHVLCDIMPYKAHCALPRLPLWLASGHRSCFSLQPYRRMHGAREATRARHAG